MFFLENEHAVDLVKPKKIYSLKFCKNKHVEQWRIGYILPLSNRLGMCISSSHSNLLVSRKYILAGNMDVLNFRMCSGVKAGT